MRQEVRWYQQVMQYQTVPYWVKDADIYLVALSGIASVGHYILVWSTRAWKASRL